MFQWKNVGLVLVCACGVDWTEKNGMAGALISFLKKEHLSLFTRLEPGRRLFSNKFPSSCGSDPSDRTSRTLLAIAGAALLPSKHHSGPVTPHSGPNNSEQQ